jgi:hypothetical protein
VKDYLIELFLVCVVIIVAVSSLGFILYYGEYYLITVPLKFIGLDPNSGWNLLGYGFWLVVFAYGSEWFRNR